MSRIPSDSSATLVKDVHLIDFDELERLLSGSRRPTWVAVRDQVSGLMGPSQQWWSLCARAVESQERSLNKVYPNILRWLDDGAGMRYRLFCEGLGTATIRCAEVAGHVNWTATDQVEEVRKLLMNAAANSPDVAKDLERVPFSFLVDQIIYNTPAKALCEDLPRLEVTTLLYLEELDDGAIGQLTLNLVPYGTGQQLYQAPPLLPMNSPFLESLTNAREWVLGTGVWDKSEVKDLDVRWSLHCKKELTWLKGGSLGGALALGILRLLGESFT